MVALYRDSCAAAGVEPLPDVGVHRTISQSPCQGSSAKRDAKGSDTVY